MVDHGGLLVAADDYHKDPSMVLKYSCDEGISWTDYTYTNTNMTIFGVITEPGEETTTVRYSTAALVNTEKVVTRTHKCTYSQYSAACMELERLSVRGMW